MYSAEYQVEIQLSRAQAWDKMRDLSRADQYVPGLTAVELTTDLVEGVGASRRVYQGSKLALDETVIEWREGEGFILRLHRGDKGPVPPLTEAYFEYAVKEHNGAVYLHNSMRYTVGLGFVGRLLHSLAIERVVASAIRDTTVAQKLYYQSGEKVTPEMLKAEQARLRSR